MIFVQQLIDEFTLTNATNPTAAYDEATTYGIGDEVRVNSTIYKSTLDDNLGNNPLNNLDGYWLEWGVANDYAMLDLEEDTITEFTADGIVEFLRSGIDTIGIGNFKASTITIDYLDDLDVIIPGETETYTFTSHGNVWDIWSYIYGGFTDITTETVFAPIKRIGNKIRVTFAKSGNATYCGYMIAGISQDMGKTLDNVVFPFRKIGTQVVSEASFNTIVNKGDLMRKSKEAKLLVNEAMMFVVDTSENTSHNNIIILGKITKCESSAQQQEDNSISWTIQKFIQE